MSINKLFAVLDCQPTTPNRLRGEARNGRRAIYVDRSRRPDGDLRDKPGCVPASGCTKGAPWRATRCIGADGSPVGGAQQRRPSPYLVSQEEKPSKSARGAGPPGTRKARRGGASKDTEKLALSDTAATTAAELGAQLAQQVMGAVHKVLNQFEGAGNTTLAACGTKLAACEAILKSMQEKVTELQQLKQVMENKSSWMPSWVSRLAVRTAFARR